MGSSLDASLGEIDMPTTAKGIYYPGPKYPAQISNDLNQMGSDVMSHINWIQVASFPPEVITAPPAGTFVGSAFSGNGDSAELVLPGPSNGSPLQESLLWVNFFGQWKKSVASTFTAAIFLNIDGAGLVQLKRINQGGAPFVQEVTDASAYTAPGFYNLLSTNFSGLTAQAASPTDTDLNAPNGFVLPEGCWIWGLQPGGHQVHVEVRYKTTAGNIALGTRYMMAGTMRVK